MWGRRQIRQCFRRLQANTPFRTGKLAALCRGLQSDYKASLKTDGLETRAFLSKIRSFLKEALQSTEDICRDVKGVRQLRKGNELVFSLKVA